MTSSRYIFPLVALAIFSCKKPIDENSPLPRGSVVSVQHLKMLYNGYPLVVTGDYVVEGQVLSSDKWGNFRRAIIVGDGNGAIEIKIDAEDYFLTYTIGQRVMLRCGGLTLGSYGGALQLGAESQDERYECGFIPGEEVSGYIVKHGLPVEQVSAAVISYDEMSPRYVNSLVRFENVQFADPDNTWGEAGEYCDRILQFPDGRELAVTTAPDAVFADYPLPRGNGTIEGILGVFNGEYSLRVNTPFENDMTKERKVIND